MWVTKARAAGRCDGISDEKKETRDARRSAAYTTESGLRVGTSAQPTGSPRCLLCLGWGREKPRKASAATGRPSSTGAEGEQGLTLGTVCIFADGSSSTRRESKGRPRALEGDRGELLSWEVTRAWASFSQDMVDRDDAHAFRDLDGMRDGRGRVPVGDVGWLVGAKGEGEGARGERETARGRPSVFAEEDVLVGGSGPLRAPISTARTPADGGKGKNEGRRGCGTTDVGCPSGDANWRITRAHTPPVILGRGRGRERETRLEADARRYSTPGIWRAKGRRPGWGTWLGPGRGGRGRRLGRAAVRGPVGRWQVRIWGPWHGSTAVSAAPRPRPRWN